MTPRFSVSALALIALTACQTRWELRDEDGDGFTVADGDCWDRPEGPEGSGLSGAEINPGASERPEDGIDQDCAGDDDYDLDGDGYVREEAYVGLTTLGVEGSGAHQGAGDCWDVASEGPDDAAVGPEAVNPGVSADDDAWYDGIDQDCAGNSDFDQDVDLHVSAAYPDAATFPPLADGSTAEDALEQGDCDDADAAISPAATEVCDVDEIDENCNDLVNGEDPTVDPDSELTWWADTDADGFGDPLSTTGACDQPDGFVANEEDCDDTDPNTNPSADEVCGGGDEDCDGDVDEDDAADAGTWFPDNDSDGYGDNSVSEGTRSCEAPAGFVADNTDCDDLFSDVNPGATEVCDELDVDEDCDGASDDDDSSVSAASYATFYTDADGDGYGDTDAPVQACDLPASAAEVGGDCDDTSGSVNPGATEVCDAADVDEDCDGTADDSDASVDSSTYATFYRDSDSDTYGDVNTTTDACDAPSGYVSDATDCDDTSSAISPAATEVCDSADTDEDCDGAADDDDASVDTSTQTTWYADEDGDGSAGSATTTQACDAPADYYATPTDCDDDASSCDSDCTTDADSDGVADCQDACLDGDADNYGTTNTSAAACLDAAGGSCVGDAVCTDADCDDANASINPAATEVCDDFNVDEDCDEDADDDDASVDPSGFTTYYRDADNDSYGDLSTTLDRCDEPAGYVADSTDCDDAATDVNPAEEEVCNDGVDNDCSGGVGTPNGVDTTCVYSDGDLSTADLIYDAASSNVLFGRAVRIVSDLDGDGNDDIVVGATGDDQGGTNNLGSVYVTTTADSLVSGGGTATTDTATTGTRLRGRRAAELVGTAIADGDLDGDGFNDVFVGGVRSRDSGSTPYGAVFVFDGSNTWWTADSRIDTAASESAYGDVANAELGSALSADGDFDNDGTVDLLVGAPGGDGYVVLLTSTTYIVSGAANSGTLREDVVFEGADSERAGASVHLSDLDGDGVADALIGAPDADVSSVSGGRVYVVEGGATGTVTLSGEASLAGPTSALGGAGGDLGLSVTAADIDGDGRNDLFAGARGTSYNSGAVSVVLGSSTFFSSSALSADLTFTGSSAEQLGFSVARAGDHNGDGADDVVFGARNRSSTAGAAYLVYGPLSAGTYTLSGNSYSVSFDGEAAGDEAGYAVHGGGDVDGDGLDDLLVGASKTGTDAGSAYLLLGLGE